MLDIQKFESEVEIESVWEEEDELHIDFNYDGAAYHYTQRETKTEGTTLLEEWLDMGYSRFPNGENKSRKYSFQELAEIEKCPLSGLEYHPMPKVMTQKESRLWDKEPDEADTLYSCMNAFMKETKYGYMVDEAYPNILREKAKIKSSI